MKTRTIEASQESNCCIKDHLPHARDQLAGDGVGTHRGDDSKHCKATVQTLGAFVMCFVYFHDFNRGFNCVDVCSVAVFNYCCHTFPGERSHAGGLHPHGSGCTFTFVARNFGW